MDGSSSYTLQHFRVIKVNHRVRVGGCDTREKTDFQVRREPGYFTLPNSRPFSSSLVPLFQNEFKCETFHMKMSSAVLFSCKSKSFS